MATNMKHLFFPFVFLLAVVFGALFASCITSGPTHADTVADRQAFSAVRAFEAAATHTPEEIAANAVFMTAWDQRITADEAAAGKTRDPKTWLAELVRVYGTAAVQVELEPVLMAKAPAMYRLLDKNGDGHLDAQEIAGFDVLDPVAAIVLTETAFRLFGKHK